MAKKRYKVIFVPSGHTGVVDGGVSLQAAARAIGENIESICGGKGSCGKCKVRVLNGTEHGIRSDASHLGPLTEAERRYAAEHGLKPEERLACQAEVRGDVAMFVPEESRAGRQVILKALTDRTMEIVPTIRKYYSELSPATLADPVGDWERLAAELASRFGLADLRIDHHALKSLPGALRAGNWAVTVTVWDGREILRVEPGYVEKAHGLAVDVGTTTIGAYLCDLASGDIVGTSAMMNPQIAFGGDVMSRIAYAKDHPGGLAELNRVLVNGLNELVRDATGRAGLHPYDIVELVMVGNTAMHHFFLGLDTVPLGLAPFTPAIHRSVNVKARDLGLEILPSANVHVLPVEAGFVGADNVGVLIAEEPYNQGEVLLIIDIGTNGELILGSRKRLLSCSCATGPAFEGASIRFGMRAAPGAIDRVRIDPRTREVDFRVIGKGERARGICGSGIIEAVAEMLRAGIIKKDGAFNQSVNLPRLRIGQEGHTEFILAPARETAIGQDIVVTQNDVRAIQLAKAALYAGAEL
ncbi:MAG: DUF4445 domain-containing protein, partial [Chloroflexi bacterium]|nr:DUF4445 domain-containing protein [Chloroflexota bacterium]